MQQHSQPPRSPRPAAGGAASPHHHHHHPRPPRYRLRQVAAFVAGAAVLLLVQKLGESGRRLGGAQVRSGAQVGFRVGVRDQGHARSSGQRSCRVDGLGQQRSSAGLAQEISEHQSATAVQLSCFTQAGLITTMVPLQHVVVSQIIRSGSAARPSAGV